MSRLTGNSKHDFDKISLHFEGSRPFSLLSLRRRKHISQSSWMMGRPFPWKARASRTPNKPTLGNFGVESAWLWWRGHTVCAGQGVSNSVINKTEGGTKPLSPNRLLTIVFWWITMWFLATQKEFKELRDTVLTKLSFPSIYLCKQI